MNILYFANPNSVHDAKWINHFAIENEVIVISHTTKNETSSLLNKIEVLDFLPSIFPYKNPFQQVHILKKLKKIIKDKKIDIIHTMYVYPNAFWAYKLKFNRHIITTRGSDILVDYNQKFCFPKLRERFAFFAYKRLFENALNHAIYITSTSEKQQKVIQTFIKNSSKLQLIRTGVDIDFLKKLMPMPNKKSSITLFSIRGIKEIYNIDLIINAFELILKAVQNVEVKLKLASFPCDQRYLDKIKSQITELGLQKKCEILPFLNRENMALQLANADIIISVPKSDGTPVSLLEAMIAKKPIIMNDLEYDQDLFNNDTIWQIQKANAIKIKEEVLSLLQISQQEIEQKTSLAQSNVERYADLKKSLIKVKALYDRMLH